MSVHDQHVLTAKLVKAGPGTVPREVQVDLGGTFEFRNHYPDYPIFEIIFEEPGPPSGNHKLTGTSDEPIYIHMPHEKSEYHYHIIYKKKDGESKCQEGPFLARSCLGCR